jgi:hypothetical protein
MIQVLIWWVDVPVWEDGLTNTDFNTRTIPLLGAEKAQFASN